MVKIKISYEKPEELQQVMSLLQPMAEQCRIKHVTEGKYKRAYITSRKEEPDKT